RAARAAGHHRRSHRQTYERGTRGGQDQGRRDQQQCDPQKVAFERFLFWRRDQQTDAKRGDHLQHFGVGLVVTVKTSNSKVPAGRGRKSQRIAGSFEVLLERLPRDRSLAQRLAPFEFDLQRASTAVDDANQIAGVVDGLAVGFDYHISGQKPFTFKLAAATDFVYLQTAARQELLRGGANVEETR